MLRPKWVVGQRSKAVVYAPLLALLSMGVCHQALADCTGVAGGTIVCTDTSVIPFDNTFNFSSGTSASDGNYAVKVQATAATEGEANLENSYTISGSIVANGTNDSYRVYGIKGADSYGIEEFTLDNTATGNISASHTGLGIVAGVYLENDAEAWTINNAGTISVVRGPLTVTAFNPNTGAITAKDGFGTSGTMGIAAGFYNNEEEIRDHNIINDGTIQANGAYTSAIFTRSNSFELVNNGTIVGYETAPGALSPMTGTAAAIVTWDGRLLKNLADADLACTAQTCTGREAGYGKTFIENNGSIIGNVIVTGANGLQVLGALGYGVDPVTLNGTNLDGSATNIPGGLIDRRDSEITNNGSIAGNIYLGQGAHVLTNGADGEIVGDVIVDQRRATNYLDRSNYGDTAARQINDQPYQMYVAGRSAAFAEGDDDDDAGGAPEIYTSADGLTYAAAAADAAAQLVEANPDHHFTFENAGTFDGNVTVLTNEYYAAAASISTPHTVDLVPHITGSA